jgi:hypothetical protein
VGPYTLGGDEDNKLFVGVTTDTAADVVTATCDYMLRLLATCEEHAVYIYGHSEEASTPLSGAALSLFFQEGPSCLRKVTLNRMALSAGQCRALAAMSRFDVELSFVCCSLPDDAAGAFVECLQSDGGPVKLVYCEIDGQIPANALAGNSRLTSLKPYYQALRNDAETAILFTALTNNKGLVDLDLFGRSWATLCESLKAHPTLTILDLRDTRPLLRRGAARMFQMLPSQRTRHRTRAISEIVQQNTVLHSVKLLEEERDEQIFTESILPRLELNRYRPRVLAIKKADIQLRRPLLGLALQTESVRNKSNLIWIFLSGNPDVLVRPNSECR